MLFECLKPVVLKLYFPDFKNITPEQLESVPKSRQEKECHEYEVWIDNSICTCDYNAMSDWTMSKNLQQYILQYSFVSFQGHN